MWAIPIQVATKGELLTLSLPINPKPIQSVRFSARCGYVQTFQPKANKAWKLMVKNETYKQLPQGFKPFKDVPLLVHVIYKFPPLSSFKKAEKALIENGDWIFKYTKPDVNDNLNKGLFDAFTGVLWDDDSRVAYALSSKVYAKEPGILVVVSELPVSMKGMDFEEGND